ncbi:MAG TPA: hypothetical protein VGG33_04975 [Polyangia bacterium]
MSRRQDIVNRALWWADPGTYRVWPSHLITFFARAGAEQVPTEKEAQEAMGYGGGVKVGGQVKHWCGVFATSVLADCGLDVKWTLLGGKIRPSSDVTLIWTNQGMQPGDIALIAQAQHHFIIVDIDYSRNYIESVDGNQARQTIKRLNTRKIRYTGPDATALHPYAYYRING